MSTKVLTAQPSPHTTLVTVENQQRRDFVTLTVAVREDPKAATEPVFEVVVRYRDLHGATHTASYTVPWYVFAGILLTRDWDD